MEPTTAVTIASLLTAAGETLASGVSIVWDLITSNALTSLFAGAGVVTLGFRFFKKAKNVAR